PLNAVVALPPEAARQLSQHHEVLRRGLDGSLREQVVGAVPENQRASVEAFLRPTLNSNQWAAIRGYMPQTEEGRGLLLWHRRARITRSTAQGLRSELEANPTMSVEDARAFVRERYGVGVERWNRAVERASVGRGAADTPERMALREALYGSEPLALRIDTDETPPALRDPIPGNIGELLERLDQTSAGVFSGTSSPYAPRAGYANQEGVFLTAEAIAARGLIDEQFDPALAANAGVRTALGVLGHESDHSRSGFAYLEANGDPDIVTHNLVGETRAFLRADTIENPRLYREVMGDPLKLERYIGDTVWPYYRENHPDFRGPNSLE
ncbi:MAG: hypothetical protein AAFY60_22065, partial [Myxococcota bacterium]